ncbi:MAG TPA: OstA-like protein [Gemmatimonadota bacterium]|nr:OstA-like protein [Gemmatimonadota bacterium]
MRSRKPGVFLVLASALLGTAAAAGAQEEAPLVIEHADEIERVMEADSLSYNLTGNVRARRGDLHMRSQRAVIQRTSGVADFTRAVRFWDATTEIFADRVVYHEATDVAIATGSVQVVDRQTGSNVAADTVRYDRRLGLVTAWPRPHGYVLSRDTTDQQDPFHVYADTMRFVSDSTHSEFVGVGEVLIERTDLTAIGDSLHYDDRTGRVAIRREPQIETAETFLTAETIDVGFADDEIESLIAVGTARAVQKTDSIPRAVPPAFGDLSDTSWMEGDSIHIAFVDQAMEWLVAEGNARSFTYARESPRGPVETWSVNYLMGSMIRLEFRGATLDVVTARDQRGVYRQEEVRVGGPERRPSEPIPWPAGLAAGDRRAAPDRTRGRRA